MLCQRKQETPGACDKRATMFVMARGGKGWDGYYCSKHALSIVRLRMHLIKKYKQNVVLRPITPYDKKRWRVKR